MPFGAEQVAEANLNMSLKQIRLAIAPRPHRSDWLGTEANAMRCDGIVWPLSANGATLYQPRPKA